MTANQRLTAELSPQNTRHSGAAAVLGAADNLAAEHQRVIDENAELHCRVQELEAENAELRERVEEYEWDHKDDRPKMRHG
ncbi:hypothetical protein [Mycobacterium intracellulare]|uniref:Uncharacterized protein n=1 Tax=Mycobacterium intracellulare TaxID=1767 RepID=A0AAE4RJR9_MYCIT|nr:hypothetical protein [Mycobacterium intracellulare]MDV6979621.1 hypothetical protein [Mycobacterium intracellulare]MDV6985124.1 hypothetical protein [Mycobacterium intracellulare]MDV7014256.1 hypothetical protein [Mycobacterium intracellulare]MDV7030115.1 hypothetical protein [Mycobacterium intracellulare]